MTDYKNKKILIVGLGKSGVAAANYLFNQGAIIAITDNKKETELKSELLALRATGGSAAIQLIRPLDSCSRGDGIKSRDDNAIEIYLGSNPPELFEGRDLIVVSPGVPLNLEGFERARSSSVPIVCEMEIGLEEISGRVIAITGTNGKSTTTMLVGEMLKQAGKNVWVGGNIGRPLLGDIEEAKSADYVVLEVSSYQLETTLSLKPEIAIWLNATPDHLDRYSSFDKYVEAKTLLGKNQNECDWIIYNGDDQIVREKIQSFKSKKIPFSIVKKLDSGAWYENNILKVMNHEIDTTISRLKGVHNRENIAAASMTAVICGLNASEIEKGLASFEGLPHRLRFVREVEGVNYFNDSKGTNVGAVIRSIESFSSPIILIAGGQDKNTGYQALRDVVSGRVRLIVAIGEAARRLKEELGDVVEVALCSSMDEAVTLARSRSERGDTVLLSPACASFDMYKNYAERGEHFTKCVEKL